MFALKFIRLPNQTFRSFLPMFLIVTPIVTQRVMSISMAFNLISYSSLVVDRLQPASLIMANLDGRPSWPASIATMPALAWWHMELAELTRLKHPHPLTEEDVDTLLRNFHHEIATTNMARVFNNMICHIGARRLARLPELIRPPVVIRTKHEEENPCPAEKLVFQTNTLRARCLYLVHTQLRIQIRQRINLSNINYLVQSTIIDYLHIPDILKHELNDLLRTCPRHHNLIASFHPKMTARLRIIACPHDRPHQEPPISCEHRSCQAFVALTNLAMWRSEYAETLHTPQQLARALASDLQNPALAHRFLVKYRQGGVQLWPFRL